MCDALKFLRKTDHVHLRVSEVAARRAGNQLDKTSSLHIPFDVGHIYLLTRQKIPLEGSMTLVLTAVGCWLLFDDYG